MLKDIESFKEIKAMVESKGFEVFIDYLKSQSLAYVKSIVTVDNKKNEVVYTEHDVNRKILGIINDLINAPIGGLNEIYLGTQDDENRGKIHNVIEHTKDIIGTY